MRDDNGGESWSDGRSALLVLDVQEAIVERYGGEGLLERLEQATTAARAYGVLVIYVVIEFRPGYPEISPRNRNFSRIVGTGFLSEPSPVHPAITPRPGDIEVTRRRVSAFAGTELELLLRAREIQSLALCGITTSGVVLSTTRAAADLDYRLTVLEDGCLDSDPDVHRVLCTKVFTRQAEVLDVRSWMGRLAQPRASA